MSSSHARLHFFLTSSFHRFFFHESVFFYENEQSHIQTIYQLSSVTFKTNVLARMLANVALPNKFFILILCFQLFYFLFIFIQREIFPFNHLFNDLTHL